MKKVLKSEKVPSPIGPYSQAVEINGLYFFSGQIALNPQTGELMLDNIKVETNQVMMNIEALLLAAGLDWENVVKSSIFIKDMGQFSEINEVYAKYFKTDFPARECVQVAALPKNVNVEITIIASK